MNRNSIHFLRGNAQTVVNSASGNVPLADGQPLYITDKNYLTVGGGGNNRLTKSPIYAREVVGYLGDTNSNIGSCTSVSYSIRGNGNSIQINASRVTLNCNLQATGVGTSNITSSGNLNITSSNPYSTISTYLSGAEVTLTPYNVAIDASSALSVNTPHIYQNSSTYSQSTGANVNYSIDSGINGGSYESVYLRLEREGTSYNASSLNIGLHGSGGAYLSVSNGSATTNLSFPPTGGTIATESFVNNAVANAGGGGGGSSISVTNNPDGTVNLVISG